MSPTFVVALSIVLTLAAGTWSSQDPPPPVDQKPQLVMKPMRAIASVKGSDLYTEYCAQCHGVTGRGDGPAAKSLKKPPADLTTIAARNGGNFPGERVLRYIHGRDRPGGRVKFVPELRRTVVVTADGPMDMPPYGVIFDNMWSSWPGQSTIRLRNLVKYVESLQVR